MVDPNNYVEVYVDSSLWGLGVFWGKKGYAEVILPEIKRGWGIVHFEKYNVVVAVAHWAHDWRGRTVQVNR